MMNEKIKERKGHYAVPVYNIDKKENKITDEEIQSIINAPFPDRCLLVCFTI